MAWAFALGAVVVGLVAAGSAALEPSAAAVDARRPQASSTPRLLDRLTADFLEDERGGRVLAALDARIFREGDRTWLSLTASPVGPRVVAPPGAEGVAGYNRISAREIAALAGGARLTVLARAPRAVAEGRVRLGAEHEILERVLDADGSVRHVAVELGTPSREVCFEVDLAGHGLHEVEVLSDGRPRVRVRCRHGPSDGRVISLGSLSAHDGERP